jgi:hypothetical protein
MASDSLPVVRISDDGELADVRNVLDQLGVDWVADMEEPERPTALWIANPRRLVAHTGDLGERAPFRIVVADKLTETLQSELERHRLEFLISQPTHPAALRLLILHALYVGPERRASLRVAVSAPVRLRAGVFGRQAQLIEISRGGCRIVAKNVPAAGEHVGVVLPRELTGDAPLHLTGRIVAVDPAGGWEPGEQACSVAFEDLPMETRRALRLWMTQHADSTAMLPHRSAPKKTARGGTKKKSAGTEDAASGERRRSTRRAYAREVLASTPSGARVLIGRDLSSGGMRVAPDSDLRVGAEFKLLVYGPAGRPPLLLRSRVLRDDADGGCVLGFQDVASEVAAELQQWTELLPNLAGSEGATSSVVSEMVDDAD